jgi:hypothetical protein
LLHGRGGRVVALAEGRTRSCVAGNGAEEIAAFDGGE